MKPGDAWSVSGGGARFCQAKALIDKHLDAGGEWPKFMVGNSAGGLLVMLYAHCGRDGATEEMYKITKRSHVFGGELIRTGREWLGYWDSKPLQKILKRIASYKKNIDYLVCAYNIKDKKTEYFDHSVGWYHLAATACMPVIVQPQDCYIDGGIVENHPLARAIDEGYRNVHLFSCSAPHEPKPHMPRNVFEMVVALWKAKSIEIDRDNVKWTRERNFVPGKYQVQVTHHVPKQNLIDTFEFDRMKSVYELLMSSP